MPETTGQRMAGSGSIQTCRSTCRPRFACLQRMQIATPWPKRSCHGVALILNKAIVEAGGVAAAMNGLSDWAAHPQGRAVATEPLIHWHESPGFKSRLPAFAGNLDGLKVLDLTRVLAGPVATRFLAGFGASVLRIDPPHWREDGIEPEVTLGKACASLDLNEANDRARFESLLSEAHVFVHGYRPGALDRLGYGESRRRELNPDIIDVSLSAYGWTGPWRERRGFDSIVQVNSGLAQEGMTRLGTDKPVQLPIQALDHGTGYLMAAAALCALRLKRTDGRARSARLSLGANGASADFQWRSRSDWPNVKRDLRHGTGGDDALGPCASCRLSSCPGRARPGPGEDRPLRFVRPGRNGQGASTQNLGL